MKSMNNNTNTILTKALGNKACIIFGGSIESSGDVNAESPRSGGFRVSNGLKKIQEMIGFSNANNTTLQVMNVTNGMAGSILLQGIGTDRLTENQVSRKEMRVRRTMRRMNANWMHYAIVAILNVSVVYAQGAPRLDLKMEEEKVNLTDVEKRDASTISYLPGDTLLYNIVASNIGDGLMTEPEVVDPIPAGVTYLANTAMGANATITFSIDQGNTYMAWPPTYTVRNAQGELIEREAGPEMVTHIKWSIQRDLNPGDTSNLEFMVEVSR